MFKNIRNAAIAATLGVATMMSANTAQARDHWRHYGHGGDDAAIAIGAGAVGLAVGAAIASDHRGRYYDDRRYYRSYPREYYYYDSYPRSYYYRDYPRYRYHDDWRWERRHWHDRDRYYRRGW